MLLNDFILFQVNQKRKQQRGEFYRSKAVRVAIARTISHLNQYISFGFI